MSEVNIPKNYPENMKKWRGVKVIDMLTAKYKERFGVEPIRQGKENKFAMGDGTIKSINQLWEDLYGKGKKRNEMGVENFEKQTEGKVKKSVKVEKKSKVGGTSYKQVCRDLITAGKTKAEVMSALSAMYVKEGKDKVFAEKRAKAIYADISRN